MKRILNQTKIREQLDTLNLPQPGSNRGYAPSLVSSHSVYVSAQGRVDIFFAIGLEVILYYDQFLAGMLCPLRVPKVSSLGGTVKLGIPKYFYLCKIGFSIKPMRITSLLIMPAPLSPAMEINKVVVKDIFQ